MDNYSEKVLALICAAFFTGCLSAPVFAQHGMTGYRPKAVEVMPNRAYSFYPEQVKLLDGPFKESQDAEASNLLSLNTDRLLAPFLAESGLPTKAPYYQGWESGLIPGVALSFYLSGISRLYMETGNKEFLNRINYILTQLQTCQKKNNGYLLGIKDGKQLFDRVEKEGCFPGFGFWGNASAAPYYCLEKLFSGLRDVYRICHIPKALEISIGMGNWLSTHMSHISDTELQKIMHIEYGGMNWVLADLYADTGEKLYLKLSNRWQDNITVVPMINGNDVLNGQHGNMQFPKFSGLAARYPFSGDSSDLTGALFFWDNVVNHRSYVTGGNTESEFFGPKDSLSKRLTPYTEENCNVYNMLRLTSLLFNIEPRVEYADYFERTLFNHILAAQNLADGRVCYHLPLMPGAEKIFQPLENFSCCSASGMDSYTRHAEYIYSHTGSSIYVNLFIASQVNFTEKGLVIKQETSFPDKDVSTLTVRCAKPVITEMNIRNPYWAGNRVSIEINGKPLTTAASKDGYFHIRRNWNNDDKVEIKLPMKLRTESMPDDKNMVALFYGPILLAADLDDKQAGDLVKQGVAPALITGNPNLDDWLKPTGIPLTFTTTVSEPGQVQVIPFFRKKLGTYSVYWDKLSEAGWKQRLAAGQQKEELEKMLDRVTIDQVSACDSVSEVRHHLSGASTTGSGNNGILNEFCWRVADRDFFSYEMLVSDSLENTLFCKYMGRKDYETWNCRITVDGTTIQTLNRSKDDSYTVRLWNAAYAIPLELTKGKRKVTIAFDTMDNKIEMPRLIQMRILNTGVAGSKSLTALTGNKN